MSATPTLVFTTGLDPFQALINLSTFSRAGHVAIGLGPELLHAYEPGVKLDSREWWLTTKRQRLVAEYEIVPDISKGLAECLGHIGEPYDVLGAVRAAIAIALRRLWSPLRAPWPASISAHTCASFVMLLDPHGERIHEWREIRRSVVTPADLLVACEGASFRSLPSVRAL